MQKQKFIWGNTLEDWEVKPVCRLVVLLHWLLLWKQVLELFWVGSQVSLFCPITFVGTLVESRVLVRNKSIAGLVWHLFLPWDPRTLQGWDFTALFPPKHLRTCSTLFPSWTLPSIHPCIPCPSKAIGRDKWGHLCSFLPWERTLPTMHDNKIFCVCYIT